MNPRDPDRRVNLPATIVALVAFAASCWILAVAIYFGVPALFAVFSLSIPIEAAR